MDFFGSLAVSDANSLALMPVASDAPSEPDSSINSGYGTDFVALSTASTVMSQVRSHYPQGSLYFWQVSWYYFLKTKFLLNLPHTKNMASQLSRLLQKVCIMLKLVMF